MTAKQQLLRMTARGSRRALALGAAAAAAVTVAFAAGGAGTGHAQGTPPEVKGLFGNLPAVGTPSKGGTISIGFLTGATPLTIFPITANTQASVYTSFGFQYDFFVPLYNGPVGG